MTDSEINEVMRSFTILAPGFGEWRQKFLRSLMRDYNMRPDEAAEEMRRVWRTPLARYDAADIQSVLERMEGAKIDVPFFGDAPRVIAKECQSIVDKRVSEQRNQEWRKGLERPEGDTSPDCTPAEVRELKERLGDIFAAMRMTSRAAMRANTDEYQGALAEAKRTHELRVKRAHARRMRNHSGDPLAMSPELLKESARIKKRLDKKQGR